MDVKKAGMINTALADEIGARKADNVEKAKQGNAGAAKNHGKNSGYNVSLSSQAREMDESRKSAFDIAKNTSPVRADRVAALKAQIANGTYQVDPGKIADGIAREALKDHLAITDLT